MEFNSEGWQLVGLLFFSAIKFFLAPSACVVSGYGFVASVLISSIGGCLGFIGFYKFGQFFSGLYLRYFPPKENKKLFSRKNKMLVKVKGKWGYWGLALLTPFVLGVPVAGILASIYYPAQKNIIPVFCSSIVLASFLLTFISIYLKNF